MGFRGQILIGLGWVGVLRLLVKTLAFTKLVVLARLLSPEAFGQFGIAALSLTFFETVTETGVNQVLIYSRRNIKNLIDSAWIVSIVRGIVVSLLVLSSAYPLAWYFRDASVAPLVALIAVAPLVRGFINPMIVTFIKELDFRREFLFRCVSMIVDFSTALMVGYFTHSPIAFVVALLSSAVIDVVLSFALFPIHPKIRFVRSYLSEILGYGKWVTLAGIAYWGASELDDFVAGRLYGTEALGGYQTGYKIATLPVTEISGTVNQVAFPVLSKSRDERKKFISIFLSSVGISTAAGLSIGLLLFLFPAQIVTLMLGPQWISIVPFIPILAVFGIVRTVESSFQPLVFSLGKPSITSFGNLIKVGALMIGLSLFSNRGVEGIATAALVSGLAVLPYYAVMIPRLLR